MMNLWQLRVFLEVGETGSFSAAATKLHMTQPGVSQQIRALENHLGTPLFLRRGHGVELTAAGFELQEPARRLITFAEAAENTLKSRRGEVSGRVRLGCALASAPFIINSWLGQFRSVCPDVTIQLEYCEPGPLIGSLRAQELDGGCVLGRMRGRGLVHHRIMEDPVTLIVPLNHPWSSASEVSRAVQEFTGRPDGRSTQQSASARAAIEGPRPEGAGDGRAARYDDDNWVPAIKPGMLKDQPIVLEHGLGESHSDARRALNDALEERGLTTRDLRVVVEVPDPASVAFAVAEGLGVGLVPTSIARRFVGQVVAVRIEGFTLVQHVYLIRDRKALNSPTVAAWWKFIEGKAAKQDEAAETPRTQSAENSQAPPMVQPVLKKPASNRLPEQQIATRAVAARSR